MNPWRNSLWNFLQSFENFFKKKSSKFSLKDPLELLKRAFGVFFLHKSFWSSSRRLIPLNVLSAVQNWIFFWNSSMNSIGNYTRSSFGNSLRCAYGKSSRSSAWNSPEVSSKTPPEDREYLTPGASYSNRSRNFPKILLGICKPMGIISVNKDAQIQRVVAHQVRKYLRQIKWTPFTDYYCKYAQIAPYFRYHFRIGITEA